jgi:TolB protein
VLDLQTGETMKIDSFGRTTLSPRHSPDGRYIALGLVVDGSSKLFLCNADGTDMRPLLISYGINVSPSWSPRGDQLAYMSDRTNDPHLYVVNVDGSDDHRITFEGKYNASPSWSPRGDRIAFVAGDTLTTSRGLERRVNIYTSDVNGENLMRLTGIDGLEGNNTNPTWSPDGLQILFSSDRMRPHGDSKLYIMNWDGTDVRPIVTRSHNITPSWGPRP